jgi:hypothetical protein
MLILFAILIAVGMGKGVQSVIQAYTDGIKEKEQTKREAIHAAERMHTLRVITESPARYQLEAPIRGLIGKLEDADVIELPGADVCKLNARSLQMRIKIAHFSKVSDDFSKVSRRLTEAWWGAIRNPDRGCYDGRRNAAEILRDRVGESGHLPVNHGLSGGLTR